MVTKTKIKNLLNPGGALCRCELIEKIQIFTKKYDNGLTNMKHIIIGLFIASGLSHFNATAAFFKIQTLRAYNSEPKCPVCGDIWIDDDCINCGHDCTHNVPF